MPKRFLTDADRNKLNNFPNEIPYEDVIKYFTLSYTDQKIIPKNASAFNRLGFTIQLCTLRYMGFVPPEIKLLPINSKNYLLTQLNIDNCLLDDYGKRKNTRILHFNIVKEYLGFTKLNDEYMIELMEWLNNRSMEHDKPSLLLHLIIEKLYHDKIVRPGITTLEEIVSTTRLNARNKTYDILKPIMTEDVISFLDDLLKENEEIKTYPISWLKSKAISNTPENLIESIKKLDYLKNSSVDKWDISKLNPNRIKYLSAVGKRTTVGSLKKLNYINRYPIMIAFLYQTLIEITDETIDIFNGCLEKSFKNAKKDYNNFKRDTDKKTNKKVKLLRKIGNIVLNDNIEDMKLRNEIYNIISKDNLEQEIKECDDIIRPDDDSYYDFLKNKYGYIRKFSPIFLKSFSFFSNKLFSSLIDAIDIMNTLNETNKRNIPEDATLDFIPAKWMRYVLDKNGKVNRNFYELSILSVLKEGLKSGDIYVNKSRYFSDPSTYLIDDEKWSNIEPEVCRQIHLPIDGNIRLNERIKDTSNRYNSLNKLLNKSESGKIRMENNQIVVSPIQAIDKPESLKGLESLIDDRLPEIDLSDLLIEVDSWINYSNNFQHTDSIETKADPRHLYAAIMGIGSNLGLTRMAQISSLSYHKLSYISNWYIREETIKAACDEIVNYHYHIPLSKYWGDGSLSSSDGYSVQTSGKVRNAQYLPRKFGPNKGITFYSWTGDIYSQYGSKVIPANVRDATYVLDGILNNETELSVIEHTTDTAGYTYIVFALFDLLGLRFSPRIRDLKDQSLFRVDDKKYSNLEHRIKDKINTKLILTHWDELKRIVGSLKLGWVSASLYITKLQSYPRKNVMTKVLQEYGKLIKTNFILRYLEDEEFRRVIHAQLNKGEEVNALRNFLTFANDGIIRKKQLEEQMVQASCITLLSNVVMTWNTVYISEIISKLIDEGYSINNEDLSRLSPARFAHINPYGKLEFNVDVEMNRKGLRPLKNQK